MGLPHAVGLGAGWGRVLVGSGVGKTAGQGLKPRGSGAEPGGGGYSCCGEGKAVGEGGVGL